MYRMWLAASVVTRSAGRGACMASCRHCPTAVFGSTGDWLVSSRLAGSWWAVSVAVSLALHDRTIYGRHRALPQRFMRACGDGRRCQAAPGSDKGRRGWIPKPKEPSVPPWTGPYPALRAAGQRGEGHVIGLTGDLVTRGHRRTVRTPAVCDHRPPSRARWLLTRREGGPCSSRPHPHLHITARALAAIAEVARGPFSPPILLCRPRGSPRLTAWQRIPS